MNKIHVYFIPGLAASSKIFEYIKLPEDQFEMHMLEWFLPEKHESLQDYAHRMVHKIKHDNPVLVGVSFGGILAQEMAEFIPTKKIIIISSVKSRNEFPLRMKMAKKTNIHKLIPTSFFCNIETLAKYAFGETIKKRVELYKIYLSVRDKNYLDWAIEQVVSWKRIQPDKKVIHIHGDKDEIFPIKNIQNCIVLKGGTHVMIINKYKWLNEQLPKLITTNEKE